MRGSILPPQRMSPTLRPRNRSGFGEHGGKSGGAGTLRHGLLQCEEGVDRPLDQRLVDQDDVAHTLTHHRQRQLADIRHRDAFGQRRAAARPLVLMDRVPHRWIERGLDADDLDRRPSRPRRDGAAGDQPAAADRHHQHVKLGSVFEHFERDRALPADDFRIVVRMHPHQVLRCRDRLGTRLRLRHCLAVENDGGAERLGRLDFHERRRHRHDDGCRNGKTAGVIRDRLRVIAGGHRNDAAAAFVGGQRGELDAGAAFLEGVRDLQILVFDEDLGAGQRRQRRRRQERRAQHVTADRAAGHLDIGKRHHRRLILISPVPPPTDDAG